jgi:menaquinone-dependent protoporphyrinogen oxidase
MSKVLVAYASKRGSTAEIAEAIAEKLREFSLGVDCLPAEEVSSLEPYDAIVLGSAVYINRWQGDARHFLHKHAGELSKLPFWVFSSGPVGDPSAADPAALEPARIVDQVEHLGVRGHIVFGGRLPTEPHGPLERAIVRHTPRGYRDRRDWGEIIEWAARIAADLGAHRTVNTHNA